jgi:alpha-galactosidase
VALKITFLGAGSTIFAKNVLGDCLLTPSLREAEIALYDIDPVRLTDSLRMLEAINNTMNGNRARIFAYCGVEERRKALTGARFVVNAIQVGGYEPSTMIDFEVPKKYGIRQTIGDTLGIGGIFRGLRTVPVLLEIAREMEAVCPGAWFLNYVNPMAIVTGALLEGSGVNIVGLCHSVQVCAQTLLEDVGLDVKEEALNWKIAGINHMAWLLEITEHGKDLYPEIKRRVNDILERQGEGGTTRAPHPDTVRLLILKHFGYYVTESSEHNAEYTPYWIKSHRPELIERYGIPLDEYPRRCRKQIEDWEKQREELTRNLSLRHEKSREYASFIMNAMEIGVPFRIHGNILNRGLIPNLPSDAVVEVPCLVDRNGVQGTYVGPLPPQCAALNLTNINVQKLTIEAALTRKRDLVYQAAFLDPRCASELTLDEIRSLCDDLFEAHGAWLPAYT